MSLQFAKDTKAFKDSVFPLPQWSLLDFIALYKFTDSLEECIVNALKILEVAMPDTVVKNPC
jgi:hypothetical protein